MMKQFLLFSILKSEVLLHLFVETVFYFSMNKNYSIQLRYKSFVILYKHLPLRLINILHP